MSAAPQAAQPGGAPELDESIVQVLASKIFIDWLRNRQQLLVPLTLDLQKLEDAEGVMLVDAMVCAASADGAVDAAARRRLEAAMRELNASEAHHAALARAGDQPKPLSAVLCHVTDVQTASMVYGASLLAIDRRKRVNHYYLRYLAERLKLPKDLVHSLEQRFVAAT